MRQFAISDRFLSSILDSAFDAVVLIDTKGRVTAFNPAAERLFERVSESVISSDILFLSPGAWRGDIQPALRSQDEGILVQTDVVVDEESKSVEISAAPIYDRNLNRIATSLIIRDITSRLRSENALRTNEKLAAVGRLASSIAHEINNPLESVTNILYIARQIALDPEMLKWLDLADQELRRVATIANQTLRFHQQTTAATVVSARSLIEGILSIFHGRLLNSTIEVRQEIRSEETIMCLEGEIRQVLTNLIGNAIDAMSTGGKLYIRSRTTIRWSTGAKGISITVADNGAGMSSITLSKLFEAFYTTKGASGTGLGLWISQEIVERHHGMLRVRSSRTSRRGTTFRLFLPFA